MSCLLSTDTSTMSALPPDFLKYMPTCYL